jgi:hypothetical protein
MRDKPSTPADDTPASRGQAPGRHGLSESQDPQAAARRARHVTGERRGEQGAGQQGGDQEVRLRSNYQTTLGDVAAAADAGTGGHGDSASAPR